MKRVGNKRKAVRLDFINEGVSVDAPHTHKDIGRMLRRSKFALHNQVGTLRR